MANKQSKAARLSLEQCILDYLAERPRNRISASVLSANLESAPNATRGQIVSALIRLGDQGKVDRYISNGRYLYRHKFRAKPVKKAPSAILLTQLILDLLASKPTEYWSANQISAEIDATPRQIAMAMSWLCAHAKVEYHRSNRNYLYRYNPIPNISTRDVTNEAERVGLKDLVSLKLVVSRAPDLHNDDPDVRPTFDELQKWALDNGRTGQTEQQCFDAWLAARSMALARKWRGRYIEILAQVRSIGPAVVIDKPTSDGMCNDDKPEHRCVCREEFGHRVCERSVTSATRVGAATLSLAGSSWTFSLQDAFRQSMTPGVEYPLYAGPQATTAPYKDPTGFGANNVLAEALNCTSRPSCKQMLLNYAAFLESQTTKE